MLVEITEGIQETNDVQSAPELAVIVPTFNERGNVPAMIHRLRAALNGLRWEVIFVDDNSPDGTADAVRSFAARDERVRLIHRVGRRGLSSACIDGMLATSADAVAVIDGDLQHDESILPSMLNKLRGEGLDLVVATRHASGGSMGSFNAARVLLSNLGRKVSRSLLNDGLTDPMSGFFLIRRQRVLDVVGRLNGRGFKILLDIVTSSVRPLRIGEVGYHFRSRHCGESKLDMRVGFQFLGMVFKKIVEKLRAKILLHGKPNTVQVHAYGAIDVKRIERPYLVSREVTETKGGMARLVRWSRANLLTAKKVRAFLWIGSLSALLVLLATGSWGWDARVYATAAQSVLHGGNPYAEGIAIQQSFHDRVGRDYDGAFPMTYVYSPITLTILKFLALVPSRVLSSSYFLLLVVGLGLQMCAGWEMATESERKWLLFVYPVAFYFPGLLNNDVVLSGNIAYLLYGLILTAAVPGWKRNHWTAYYITVLVASCCKAPLLSLLALPALLGRKEWFRAGLAGAAGILLFACQFWLWPQLFADYLRAVNLQFDWNRDFGFGPAGLLGEVLQQAGLPYDLATQILYVAFAAVLLSVLIYAARRVGSDGAARETWVPVALVGVILLNPRVKEYDVAPLTIPLFLIGLRFLRIAVPSSEEVQRNSLANGKAGLLNGTLSKPSVLAQIDWKRAHVGITVAGWFLAMNFAAAAGLWKPVELAVLLLFFSAGTWTALHLAEKEDAPVASRLSALMGMSSTLKIRVVESKVKLS